MSGRIKGVIIAMLVVIAILGWQSFSLALLPTEWGNSHDDTCVECHKNGSPSLVELWRQSAMGRARVSCYDCHKAEKGDIDAMKHNGYTIALIVGPKDCSRCHEKEVNEMVGSRHAKAGHINFLDNCVETIFGEPATGAYQCTRCHGQKIRILSNGKLDSNTWRNTGIGRLNPDGSYGTCSKCHLPHRFSKQEARRSRNCEICHTGTDHFQINVTNALKQKSSNKVYKNEQNTNQIKWIIGLDNVDTPSCSDCHMIITHSQGLTHDVGQKITWAFRRPISHKIDALTKIKESRREVCFSCQSSRSLKGFSKHSDEVVFSYNEKFVKPATKVRDTLIQIGKLTPADYDEPLDWYYWALWHHEKQRVHLETNMMENEHTGLEGLYDLEKNFYLRFVPEAEIVAGKQLSDKILDKHIFSLEAHRWYKQISLKEQQ